MNWGQFFLGLVTIVVATVVYRWQKIIDRETSIQSERRAVYAKYIAACKAHYYSQPFIGQDNKAERIESFFSISDHEAEVYILRDQVYLVASEQVLAALLKQDRCFRNWKISFPKPEESDPENDAAARAAARDFMTAHNDLLDSMRSELAGHQKMTVPKLQLRDRVGPWFAKSK